MKRKKMLLIMGGLLVVLCGVIAAEKLVQKHVDTIQTVDEEILSLDTAEITEVSWKYDGADLDFQKNDDTWQSTDDETFPVSQTKMDDFLDHFSSVHASFIIDDVEDYGQYGLDNPECTINFTLSDGSTTTVKLGDYSTMDSKRYIDVGDGKVYLIDDDLETYVCSDRDDMMDNSEIPSYDDYAEIDVSGEQTMKIAYDPDGIYTYTGDFDYYLIDGDEHKALDTSKVSSYISNLTGMDLSDYVTYTADDDALAEYGLADPYLTITVTQAEEDEETSESTADTESGDSTETAEEIPTTYTVTFGIKEGDDDNCYVRVDDSSIIYKVAIDTYNEVSTDDYNALRPSEVVTLDWTNVSQLDMTIDGSTYEATDPTIKDSVTTWTIGETEELDLTDITNAIDALSVTDFQDEEPSKDKEYSVTIHLENEDYPTLTIDVYTYNGDSCIVELNGEILGLVSRDQTSTLEEAINAIVLNL